MNRTLTRWLLLALATTCLPAAVAVAGAVTPAAAAGQCTGTVVVTPSGGDGPLGQMKAPGGPDAASGYVSTTTKLSRSTDVRVSHGLDGYFTLTVVGGPVVGGLNFSGLDFRPDHADWAVLNTIDGTPNIWTLDGDALTATWPNSDGARVPVHLFATTEIGTDDPRASLGFTSNISEMRDHFSTQTFTEVTFTFDQDEGADCRFTPDDSAPPVTIDHGAAHGAVVGRNPTYTFSSTADDVDHFECAVDDSDYVGCTSPTKPRVSGRTEHTFSVRAIDTYGNAGPSVSDTWTLTDLKCDRARAHLAEVRVEWRQAKRRLAHAQESGDPHAIERARAHKRVVFRHLVWAQTRVVLSCK